jgi:deazaflavin-dependent oxidoreductase (nitroreductase family)
MTGALVRREEAMVDHAPAPAAGRYGDLPYGPVMSRLLEPLHAGFGVINRYLALPALHAGLGPLLSGPWGGSMMILRTTGRTTGLRREAPLGYVIAEGAVYVCAGFGEQTAWYRNLVADPNVEVVLPTVAFAGRGERVTDPDEWGRVFPAYVTALGLVGRATLGDVRGAAPDHLERIRAELPLVRIRPTGIAPGPADPGGRAWIVAQLVSLLVAVGLFRAAVGVVRVLRRTDRRRPVGPVHRSGRHVRRPTASPNMHHGGGAVR